MPKENINSTSDTVRRLEIRWPSDPDDRGPVQVATVDTSLNPGQQGWVADLDREGCNRAIYALRKARDAVYGADA